MFRRHPYIALRELAKSRIKAGEPKQDVYDKMAPETKYKHALAIYVSNQPTLDRRDKLKILTGLCFLCAVLYGLFFGFIAYLGVQATAGVAGQAMLFGTAAIMLVVGIGMLSRSSGRFYTQYCAVIVFGLAQAPRELVELPLLGVTTGVIMLLTIGLAIYTRNRVFGRISLMASAIKQNGRYVVTPI
jgi:hypothetical protein